MDFWSSALISALLLAIAVGLMLSHVRSWRAAQHRQLAPLELDFRRRQFRRRMEIGALLGLLAAMIFVGELLASRMHFPLLSIIFWGGALCILLWMSLMAVIDMMAMKFHFSRLRQNCLIEQARLKAELQRIQSTAGNGRAATDKPEN